MMDRYRWTGKYHLFRFAAISIDITEIDNGMPTIEVSDTIIFEAVKQINPLRAPSRDGIQAIFYHKN